MDQVLVRHADPPLVPFVVRLEVEGVGFPGGVLGFWSEIATVSSNIGETMPAAVVCQDIISLVFPFPHIVSIQLYSSARVSPITVNAIQWQKFDFDLSDPVICKWEAVKVYDRSRSFWDKVLQFEIVMSNVPRGRGKACHAESHLPHEARMENSVLPSPPVSPPIGPGPQSPPALVPPVPPPSAVPRSDWHLWVVGGVCRCLGSVLPETSAHFGTIERREIVLSTPLPMIMAGHPVKRYCFTLNNYTEEEEKKIKEFLTSENCEYAVVGKEVGENGTPHLQGFVNLKKKMRFHPFKKAIGERSHIEQARGTDCDNKKYCSKGGDLLLEVGEPSAQGKRSDLKAAVAALNAGSSMSEVAREFPSVFIRYGRGLRDYVITAGLGKSREWKTEVHVIVGIPGVGKSRHVQEKGGKKSV